MFIFFFIWADAADKLSPWPKYISFA